MNITEAEKLTGIEKQTIRYYEKEGLIAPKRNRNNDYREYTMKEIQQLKVIRVLRNTGMSLVEIKKVLSGEVELTEAINQQREKVAKERNSLEGTLELCDELKGQIVENMNADQYLEWNQNEENKRNGLSRLVEDYKQVAKGESKKSFSFSPAEPITTSREFTEELLKYAKSENVEIIITKEGMYPEFIWNGIEYRAHRSHGRWGQMVHCDMLHPELAEPQGMSDKRKNVLTLIKHMIPVLFSLGVLYICAVLPNSYDLKWWEQLGLLAIAAVFMIAISWPYLRSGKKNK